MCYCLHEVGGRRSGPDPEVVRMNRRAEGIKKIELRKLSDRLRK